MNLNPLQIWASEIAIKRKELKSQFLALEAARTAATKRKVTIKSSDSLKLIDAFNAKYSPHDWMIQAGYDQRGDAFRHPNSQTGNYSANVRLDDVGELRVHSFSSADPLFTAGKGAHDAFSTFCTLVHGSDINSALKDAGDNLLEVEGMSYNTFVQREYMRQQAQQVQARDTFRDVHNVDYSTMPDYGESETIIKGDPENPKKPFSMRDFSLSGQSQAMRAKMLADIYVLNRIAILGQATVIYAKPNTGKTLLVLWLLIESVKANRISGDNIFYINADDDYKGLVNKISLAETTGFHMLSPGHNGFEAEALQGYMRQLIDDGTASGIVIILDTLKKFTDLMDKRRGSEFMNRAREYVLNGGTLISLAHTNKNRDSDGKVVFSGTSDVVDDSDCVFMLDEIAKTNTKKQVLFVNIKNRGVVARELAFSYSVEDGLTYQEILASVQVESEASSAQAKAALKASINETRDKVIIEAIIETIKAGIINKTELIKAIHDDTGRSKPRITSVLNDYCGKKWRVNVGEKNAKIYALITTKQATEDEYRRYKDGDF